MKRFAYLLVVAGFLVAAYATALDERNVDWLLFAIAAAAAIAGVVIAKRLDKSRARSGTVLATNRHELGESIGNVVRDLGAVVDGASLRGPELRAWIDDTLRPDLRRFAEARESLVHLFGLQAYADIMSCFAAGERYVNRVWSASADGYDEEATTYLARAARQFRDAQAQLDAAAQGADSASAM
jgi:hypothetical protein